jgi:hypothetical protein
MAIYLSLETRVEYFPLDNMVGNISCYPVAEDILQAFHFVPCVSEELHCVQQGNAAGNVIPWMEELSPVVKQI